MTMPIKGSRDPLPTNKAIGRSQMTFNAVTPIVSNRSINPTFN